MIVMMMKKKLCCCIWFILSNLLPVFVVSAMNHDPLIDEFLGIAIHQPSIKECPVRIHWPTSTKWSRWTAYMMLKTWIFWIWPSILLWFSLLVVGIATWLHACSFERMMEILFLSSNWKISMKVDLHPFPIWRCDRQIRQDNSTKLILSYS
ncbi:PREDICTED: uncharacterized protein LOC104606409 isoform X2 [Nelumbo nucifera]|uniref:Uncharacterized protein LOC104606409 isoform X2 n=1 Tax=Nelumbo nucifera TaxID=4432 RepID=A0A1U8Q7U1_NELNU|nr:PREDICTED: uncharacterized protein LOC104606409 isoform X2 [Nelumbo nucifera]